MRQQRSSQREQNTRSRANGGALHSEQWIEKLRGPWFSGNERRSHDATGLRALTAELPALYGGLSAKSEIHAACAMRSMYRS